jgi:hypothetical protein
MRALKGRSEDGSLWESPGSGNCVCVVPGRTSKTSRRHSKPWSILQLGPRAQDPLHRPWTVLDGDVECGGLHLGRSRSKDGKEMTGRETGRVGVGGGQITGPRGDG